MRPVNRVVTEREASQPGFAPLSADPSASLVRGFRTAAAPDLDRLSRTYRPYLHALARRTLPKNLRHRLDASDIVQETIARGLRGREQFRGETVAELTRWFRRILVNFLTDESRRETRLSPADADEAPSLSQCCLSREPSSSTELRTRDDRQQLETAVQQLPHDQQLAVRLRCEGLSFEEIGVRLDRSTEAATMLWSRGVYRLTRMLKTDA